MKYLVLPVFRGPGTICVSATAYLWDYADVWHQSGVNRHHHMNYHEAKSVDEAD